MPLSPDILQGILLPFAGTCLGAASVFLIRGALHNQVQRVFTGFAAGVMVAASVWSLLIPAMEQASASGKPAFLPAVIGFWAGVLFLLLLDHVIPHLHLNSTQAEGPAVGLPRTIKLVLAVTLHNIPEGMAVGVVYAGVTSGSTTITEAAALALSLGIAIQNFPEGAIISLPLKAEGAGRLKSFVYGVLSGVVEPIGALVMIAAIQYLLPFLPYFLSFAAGAMLYVVVEELIPEMSEGEHSNIGTLAFAAGFTLMMALDVMLG
jgi:zinc transporter, ZIP family